MRHYQSLGGSPMVYNRAFLVLHQAGFTCACAVASTAVRSYRTFPSLLHYMKRFISVALSLESPPPGVTRRHALRCSDFPHALPLRVKRRGTRLPGLLIY